MNDITKGSLEGRLEHITYYNEETHYLIARMLSKETQKMISILGYMPSPGLGETLRINGAWQQHPRYGQQFRFETFEVLLPSKLDEIRAYLQSGIISGIGPVMVARILDHFKDQTIDVIENRPDELTNVKGIGIKTATHIAKEWQTHHAARSLMRFLQQNEIKSAYAGKLMRLYGNQAEEILREDPFRVAADLPSAGFYIADKIVQNQSIPVDPDQRAQACLRYLIDQSESNGHVFDYQNNLLTQAWKIFQIDEDTGDNAIFKLSEDEQIVVDTIGDTEKGPAVYPAKLHLAETTIAKRLKTILQIPGNFPNISSEAVTEAVLKRLAIKLSETQLNVLQDAITNKVSIITGGPGTGKTTLIQSITAVLESFGLRILLAAPTGRAARRISEVTRRPAATLHKLLGCSLEDGYFEKDQDDPLDAEVIIVDEASMIDTTLFYHLLKAIPLTSMLILVGDVFQLPSVGPGNVLSDLIQSGGIPTFELTEIFRQTRQSAIVLNAHRIRKGKMPEIHQTFEEISSDFYFIEQKRPEEVINTIVKLCTEKIPNRFGLNAIEEIQVLTPMHKGIVGTLNLNRILQQHLNPQRQEIKVLEGRFGVGDKVMHLRNNYHKEVFNGDIGTIVDLDASSKELMVDYDGRKVPYDHLELDELTLAYAISIHKSQGSEYPAIIVPLLTQHYILLQRNLLYTAVTRGKQLVILIGTTKALRIALTNDKPRNRQSGLAERLSINQ